MKNVMFLLWLADLNPELLSKVPSLTMLAESGVDMQLIPLPLVEKRVCYYQTLTGMGSGKFGLFDAVRPEKYTAQVENTIPDGTLGRLLPDILRSRQLRVNFVEYTDSSSLATLASQTLDCTIARYAAGNATPDEIDAVVRAVTEHISPQTHLLVLTDVWSQAPHTFVNVNDFLADTGLLEFRGARSRDEINWSDTLAYGLGTGQLCINLHGRDAQGVVNSGSEYHEVCEALVNELSTNWLDPQTNAPVVEQVLKKEAAYTGEYLFNAPDLIIVYRPGYAASPKATMLDFDGRSIMQISPPVRGIAPYARLIAKGSSLVNGLKGTARLIDFMPAVMYILNQPIPTHVDGKVIASMFMQDYQQQNPVKYSEYDETLLSDEEEGVIVDRLRDLGYLG